jgi:uncharacterized protein YjiS (DUF1127 family)
MRRQPAPTIRFGPGLGVYTSFLVSIWQALVRRLRRRQSVAKLRALDDRMLKDIGLKRSQIDSIVHGLGRDASRVKRT